MSKHLEFQDFRLSTSSPSALARAIDNPIKRIGAAKHPKPRASRILATVSFKDIFGKVSSIECRNKSEIAKARKFFDILRVEHIALTHMLSEYPRSKADGRILKKYHAEVRRELKKCFNLTTVNANWIIENK